MATGEQNQAERAALYRQNAERLRQIAADLRFDLCRRQQVLALAAGFDRLAERLQDWPLEEAAD